jgi:hypothetical protein
LPQEGVFNFSVDLVQPLLGTISLIWIGRDLGFQFRNMIFGRAKAVRLAIQLEFVLARECFTRARTAPSPAVKTERMMSNIIFFHCLYFAGGSMVRSFTSTAISIVFSRAGGLSVKQGAMSR